MLDAKQITAAARLGDKYASLRHLVPRSRLVIFLEVESDSCTWVIQGLGFRVRCLWMPRGASRETGLLFWHGSRDMRPNVGLDQVWNRVHAHFNV